MKRGGAGRVLLLLLASGAAVAARAQVQVFTDEAAYLAALAAAGRGTLTEGFEGPVWDGVRSTIAGGTSSVPSVASQGITWTASAGVTTNDLGPRTGAWRVYDHPGGAPDLLKGASTATLYGVGGWFTANILPSSLRLLIDGVSPDNATLALDAGYQFLGVVDLGGFTVFELVGDGTPGDEKHWFADDFTIGVAAGSPAVAGVVPGVADVRGLQGSDWHTDLWIHNSGSAAVTVTLHYAAKGEAPGFAHPMEVAVAAGRTVLLADVVASGFGLTSTSGTVLYEVAGGDAAAVVVRGDTYNRLNVHERFGQNLPGIAMAGATPAGRPLYLPGLHDALQYRYNLGVQSAGARRARVRVLEGSTGAVLHDAEVAVPPLGWTQLVDLQRAFQLGSASGWYLEVTGLDGPVIASGNLIDQRSNDSVNVAGRELQAGAGGLWLAGAASAPGLLGSRWRSDLFSVNAGPVPDQAELTFFPRDPGGGSAVAPVTVAYSGGQQVVLEDLVGTAFGRPDGGAGAVMLRQVQGSGLLHFLRTYNEAADAVGRRSTYGSAMPALAEDELIGPGEEGRIVGVVDDADTRANLALLNTRTDAGGSGLTSAVEIELLAGDGSRLFRDTLALQPFENIQVNRFPERYLGSGIALADATLVVRSLDVPAGGAGGVLAAVSVVNGNRTPGVGTSDPQLIVAVKHPARAAAAASAKDGPGW